MGSGALAQRVPERRHIFYGWWMVVACGIIQFLGGGFFYYGLGSFFLPLTNEFGWSRTMTSFAISLHRLEGGIIAPVVGFAYDRFGPRALALFGVTALGVGFILMSQVTSYVGFVAAVVVMSLGFGSGFTANGMAAASNWFIRKRTLAVGLVMALAGVGGLLVPMLAELIALYGWRAAATIAGATVLIVGWPLAWVLRRNPEQYGLLPDGARPADLPQTAHGSPKGKAQEAHLAELNFGLREALGQRAFWHLVTATTLFSIAVTALVVHGIPYLTDIGMPPTLAASAIGAVAVVSVAGRLGFGWAGDRWEKRRVLGVAIGIQVVGMAVFACITEPWHLIPFLALFSPGYGGTYALRAATQGAYFGRRSFGSIQGIVLGINAFAAMLGPIFAGWMFDTLGSYRLAFWILVALLACAVPAAVAMPRQPEGRQDPESLASASA